MNIKILTSISVLSLLAAMASIQAKEFSYTYIEGAYESTDLDGPDADIFRISGSYNVSPNFNIIGDYATGNVDNPSGGSDLDFDEGSISVAYHAPVAQSTDLTANLKVVNRDTDVAGNDTGYGLGVGVRHMLSDRVEVDANVDFVDVQDVEDTALKLGARYYFNSAISAGLGYSTSSENIDVVSGNIRWDF